jgi:hypothetical protein
MLHKRLDQLFNMIRPRKTVVMALDGPAPLAKLITQRYVLQAYTRKTSNCCCVLHWPGILQPYATHGSIVDIIGIVDSFSMVGIVGIDGIVLGNTSTLKFATLSLPPQAAMPTATNAVSEACQPHLRNFCISCLLLCKKRTTVFFTLVQ